ncbi:MAG: hypothetical protein K2Y32_23585 [Candidatus Obscuribacterales bacterium]|nr:hypothetical protein [Candidatus Obscuribacterales bacterium]
MTNSPIPRTDTPPKIPARFSIEQSLLEGWRGMINSFLPFFAVLCIYWLCTALMALPGLAIFAAQLVKYTLPWYLYGFLIFAQLISGFIFAPILQMGLLRVSLRVLDGETPTPADLTKCWRYFWQFLVASFIMRTIRLPAYFCFIFPGIWIDLSFRFYEYLIVDRGMGPIESFRASNEITKGQMIRVLLTELILLVVTALGGLVFLIGAVPAYMVVSLARASMYRQILKSTLMEQTRLLDEELEVKAFDEKLRMRSAQSVTEQEVCEPLHHSEGERAGQGELIKDSGISINVAEHAKEKETLERN